MAWIPFYIIEEDLRLFSTWLEGEDDIALIESIGPRKWKATNNYSINKSGSYCLYHTKSGPLPLLRNSVIEDDGVIEDPFKGWVEERQGEESDKPFFGAGHQGIYWLDIQMLNEGVIGLSGVEWIGNHYAQLDGPVPDCTKKWWGRLGRWVKKNTERVQIRGALKGENNQINAFPAAYQSMLNGTDRAFK